MAAPSVPPEDVLRRIYRSLYLIRKTEEEIARVYPTDKIKSPVHLSIGQEAVSVGVCDALRPDDRVFGTYRGHALYLAKGGDTGRMVAELYGKVTGCSRGKGGSMHLIDPAHGFMGTSAVVATTIPEAAGYALALKREGKGGLVACFFGDGAVEEGVFYEILNFSALRKLPLFFVCENNFYAIHSPLRKRQAAGEIFERVRPFGIPACAIEDGDVFAIREQTLQFAEHIRSGQTGPCFMECKVYRWREHVGPGEDFEAGYRSREEATSWMENDPVEKTGGLLDPKIRKEIEADVEREVQQAIAFAESSPLPGGEELLAHVYAP